jgi:DNA-binding response OmpR family regulator
LAGYSNGNNSKPVPVVLIVQDNPDANSLVAGILYLKGYSSLKVQTLQECLDVLAGQGDRIDAVIFGGRVAAESGGMLVSRVKKTNPNIRMLALVDEESDRTAVIRLGVDQVVSKPLSAETVADKLTLLLAENGVLVEASGDR